MQNQKTKCVFSLYSPSAAASDSPVIAVSAPPTPQTFGLIRQAAYIPVQPADSRMESTPHPAHNPQTDRPF